MKKFLFSTIFVSLFSLVAAAQEAYKYEDVTRLRCDLGEIAALDTMLSQVFQENAKEVIIVYGDERGKATRYAYYVKGWLVNFRRVPAQFISAYYGGYSKEPKMEVWIVPNGAKEPQLNSVNEEKDATKFDGYYYFTDYCPDEREPALELFAEELKLNPNSTGYIIVYRGDKEAALPLTLRQARRKAVKDKKFLIKLGVEDSRIFTIDGGNGEQSYAELWTVPSGAKPPEPTRIKTQ